MPEEKKLLIVHDEAIAAAALGAELRTLGHEVIGTVSRGEAALEKAASQSIDLALVSFRLEGSLSGPATARQLARKWGVPTVFLALAPDLPELHGKLSLPSFAYVIEPAAPRELQMAISATTAQYASKRKTADFARWWAESLASSEEGMIGTDADGRITLINSAAEVLTGWLRHEALGRPLTEIFRVIPADAQRSTGDIFEEARASKLVVHLENNRVLVRRDGVELPISDGAAYIEESGDATDGIVVIFRSRRGRKNFEEERASLETKMDEAQRMESLGLMAGGVAHDFNNMLTAVLASVGLARLQLPPDTPANEQLDTIERASMRAAELCRQMLAYSGRGKLLVQPVQLNTSVDEALKLLRTAFKSPVSVKWAPASALPLVLGDQSQLRHTVINLFRNAIEAIGNRAGTITLSTRSISVDQQALEQLLFNDAAAPGDFVILEVNDNGAGMNAGTIAQIFDPFFTTKFRGRGLGLPAVAGIMRAHQGALCVESELGRGTTIRLYFPTEAKRAAGRMAPAAETVGELTPSVLVADDDEAIRAFAKWVVERAGFRAILARDGDQALAEFRKNPNGFALVLLDLTMPRLSGGQVLLALRELNRDVPVVFMTGYGEDAVSGEERAEVSGFLQKPFNPDNLRAILQRYAIPTKATR